MVFYSYKNNNEVKKNVGTKHYSQGLTAMVNESSDKAC